MHRFICNFFVILFSLFFFATSAHAKSWVISPLGPIGPHLPPSLESAQAKSSAVSPPGPIYISPFPPNLKMTISFDEPSGNNALDAEEKAYFIVKISNEGKGKACGVRINVSKVKAPRELVYDESIRVGDIASGKSVRKKLAIRASKEVSGGKAVFRVEALEKAGFNGNPVEVEFPIISFELPRFRIDVVKLDDTDKDDRIGQQEPVKIVARLRNIDKRKIKGVRCRVEVGENVRLMSYSKRFFELGDISSTEYKDIEFSFKTNSRIGVGEEIPIRLNIETFWPISDQKKELILIMGQPPSKPVKITVGPSDGEVKPPPPGGLDVDERIPNGKSKWKKAIAIVIGNRKYKHTSQVEFADWDAIIVSKYLEKTLGFEKNIFFYLDTTKADLEAIFGTKELKGDIFNWVKTFGSDVFIYFSGHGAPDPETDLAYLLPVDVDPARIYKYGYPLETFYQKLAEAPIKNLMIVLDVCFSGRSEGGDIIQSSGIEPTQIDALRLLERKNALILTATNPSKGSQIANWLPEKRHSLFTYSFLKALRGHADENKDGELNAKELKDYLVSEVIELSVRHKGRKQEPWIEGNFDHFLILYEKAKE